MDSKKSGCSKRPLQDLEEAVDEQYSDLRTETCGSDYQLETFLDVNISPRHHTSPVEFLNNNFENENYVPGREDNQQSLKKDKVMEDIPENEENDSKKKGSGKSLRMKNKKKSSSIRINPLIFHHNLISQDRENDADLSNPRESDAVTVESFKFNVQASFKLNSSRGPKILEISCEPVTRPTVDFGEIPNRDSFSSGNLGDVSQTHSIASTSPVRQIVLPPSWATRASQISTSSSSGSSLATSAATLAFQQRTQQKSFQRTRCLSPGRIDELRQKWYKSDMVYHILDYIDRCIYEDENIKNNHDTGEERNISSRKRPISEDNNNKHPKKRLRAFHLDPSICSTVLGKEVFAKCEDGNYYYGTVSGVTKTGQLDVDFSDVKHLCVDVEDTITSVSSLMSHSVMVVGGLHEAFYPAIVSEYFTNSFPCKFGVISDYGDSIVAGGQIYLTEFQANTIQESSISTTNNDFAVSGPSGTKAGPSGINAGISGVKPSSSGINTTNLSSSDSDGPFLKQTDMNIYKYVVGCDMEASNAGVSNSLLKLKGIAGKVPKRGNQNEDRILGPLTVSGNWFKGLNFILTCSLQNLLAPDESEDESSDTNTTDSEDYVFSKVPYVSDRLAQQIRLAGGRVLTTFEELDSALYSETYLITNRPCITARFLKCLALGVTIACHEWIINCTAKQKRLMVQELPAGWSLENGVFVTMYQRKVPRPFNGLRIQLAQYNDPNFIGFWSEICKTMGSSITTARRLDKSSNVVVAEDGYRDIILDEAIALEIPVVSAAWIVQSLIHGESRPYRAHATFDHLYEETWEY